MTDLKARLLAAQATVATAESCTGGLLATWLTELPGSSASFVGGVAAYANQVKIDLLGVDAGLLSRVGAVSAEVAAAMAQGVRERLGTTYGISLTGVAGPDGGTAAKPVGTVFCGLAGPAGVRSVLLNLHGSRTEIRAAAGLAALRELARAIQG